MWQWLDYWNCGDVIRITTASLGTHRSEAESAISDWASALGTGQQLPRLIHSSTSGAPTPNRFISVTVNETGTGTGYCGQVQPTDRTTPTNINMAKGSCGTFRDVFLHELSHVYGYLDAWEKTYITGVSDHCARTIPLGKPLNRSVCQHEVEDIKYYYGLRPAPTDPSKHILTGLSSVQPVTVAVGSNVAASIDYLLFARANSALCSMILAADESGRTAGVGAAGVDCEITPNATDVSYAWSSTNAGVFTIASQAGPQAQLRGVAAGTADVHVSVTSTKYELGSGLIETTPDASGTVTVTVPARTLAIAAGNGQTATVNTAVASAPAVYVTENGAAAAGVPVTFAVTGGGGSVSPTVVTTGTDGIARVASWTLGTTAGANTLVASAPGGTSTVSFTATGTAGAVASMVKYAGDGQTALPGTAVAVPPAVRLTDSYGNTVPGASVGFTVAAGGGTVTPSSVVSNGSGVAQVASWVLGPSAGTNNNALAASIAGMPTLTFLASGVTMTAPLSFHSTGCRQYVYGSKTYVDYDVAWTPTMTGSGDLYEIAQAATSDPASAIVRQSGPASVTSDVVGPHLKASGTPAVYLWIRHKSSSGAVSAWTPLDENPLQPRFGCLM